MQTNIPIQTVLIHKLRSISKPIIRLAKETACAPDILLSYHTILSQRPQLEQCNRCFVSFMIRKHITVFLFLLSIG